MAEETAHPSLKTTHQGHARYDLDMLKFCTYYGIKTYFETFALLLNEEDHMLSVLFIHSFPFEIYDSKAKIGEYVKELNPD